MDITTASFQITMDEEEALRDGHFTETLGWIAIDKGTGLTTDNRDVLVFDGTASSTSQVVNFGHTFTSRYPVLVSDISTINEDDTHFLRYQELGPSSVKLFLQEEQSLDTETAHSSESVHVFVAK
jgi:hypothetical protein